MLVTTVGLLVAFAMLLWAFGVLLSDLLEERARGRLHVMLVAVLAPTCALGTVVISAMAAMALATALEPGEAPVRTERTDLETTSDERTTFPETTTEETATPSATSSPSASPSGTLSPSASPLPSASPSP
jgi:hypothetical protein